MPRKPIITVLTLLLGLFTALPARAQRVYTPAPGSAERQAIMNAVRIDSRDDMARAGVRGTYEFKVLVLNVQSGWAYVVATPVSTDGRELRGHDREYDCGAYAAAVVRRTGNQWRVVHGNHNACDAIRPEYVAQLGGPPGIITTTESDSGPGPDFRGTTAALLRGDRVTADQIRSFSIPEKELLRNTVYARHGRPFTRPDLRRHFASQSWYRVRSDYSDARLNANDRANIALIARYEGR
jgi:hypothetical protein